MIQLTNVSKSYTQGDERIKVLHDVNLTIRDGEHVAIIGASGSGKSTLLSLMSGMDMPDTGTITIDNKDIALLSEQELAHLRNKVIGIIFQSFELVPSFSALENVMLPLNIGQKGGRVEATTALSQVGLAHRIAHLPSMLSGGEEQRVAIARALAQDPKILFADEPTGNLDPTTGAEVLTLIKNAAGGKSRTLVIITHDRSIARTMDRVLEIKGGKVEEVTP
jgi:putative ABC transport system ATP-binding protein